MAKKSINLVPAYGRDYKNKREVLDDFNADKDFTIEDVSCQFYGKYINRKQLIDNGYTQAYIRYKKLTQVMNVNL